MKKREWKCTVVPIVEGFSKLVTENEKKELLGQILWKGNSTKEDGVHLNHTEPGSRKTLFQNDDLNGNDNKTFYFPFYFPRLLILE